jgi:gamma-glutamyltranspeptidase/glutathione hydrolase
MTMQARVSAPRFHNQWLPDEIKMETAGFPDDVLTGVKRLGYKIANDDAFGRVDAIHIITDQAGNRLLEGGADPRGDDAALGY